MNYLIFCFLILNGFLTTVYQTNTPGYELEGIVKRKRFYGPPNYGETPKKDRLETFYFLVLDKPIQVFDKEENQTFNGIKQVQMVSRTDKPLEEKVNQRIKIKGTLFTGNTGHHHTRILLSLF